MPHHGRLNITLNSGYEAGNNHSRNGFVFMVKDRGTHRIYRNGNFLSVKATPCILISFI